MMRQPAFLSEDTINSVCFDCTRKSEEQTARLNQRIPEFG
jgi:hypothetical protein